MKLFQCALFVLFFSTTLSSQAQTEITSAGSDFSFSFLQNRHRPKSTSGPSYQPMSDDHSEISLMIYVSNAEILSTNVDISFSGNEIGENEAIRFRYVNGGQTEEKAEASFILAANETKEVEVIVTEKIQWLLANGNNRAMVDNKALAMAMDNGHIQKKVFRVRTTNSSNGVPNKVTVFAESSQVRSRDAALVLPTSALGNEYYVFTSQIPTGTPGSFSDATLTSGAGNHGGPCQIVISAIEDNTYLEVYFPDETADPWGSVMDGYDGWNHKPGVNIFRLNRGECVQLQSDTRDLTGVFIRGYRNDPTDVSANEDPIKFAVFSGNMATNVSQTTNGAYDHVYEQMYPSNTWSCRYIATNSLYGTVGFDDKRDFYRILTAKDGTQVTIDFGNTSGTTVVKTINTGEVILVEKDRVRHIDNQGTSNTLSSSYNYGSPAIGIALFEANGPISVAQFTASESETTSISDKQDPSMMMLSPVDQPIDEVSFPLPPRIGTSSKQDRIVVIREVSSGQNDVKYTVTQGGNTASTTIGTWTQVPTNTNYEFAISQISLSGSFVLTDPMSVRLEYTGSSSSNMGFNAYIYGLDDKEAYSCAAGISALPRGTGSDKTVCIEPGGSISNIQLSAFGGNWSGAGSEYTWTLTGGPGNFATTQTASTVLSGVNEQNPKITYALTEKGTYTFSCTIKRDGTCDITWDQVVIVKNCCEARLNDHYDIRYSTSQTLSEEVNVWSNKVYIDDRVMVTVDGGVLDVTNVDVVLGECAQIVLKNGAILRANNSVFRACNSQFPWKGIHFESDAGAESQINESTFKNAIMALEFENTGGGVISNNLFYNNYAAIDVSSVTSIDFNWPITGNRFVVDGKSMLADPQEIFWVGCEETLQDNEHFGIVATNVTFIEPLSQNEFVSSFRAEPHQKKFKGIVMSGSNATVSYNTFTNMFKSVTLDDVETNFIIQSNEIELTTDKANISPQIEVFGSTAIISIANNELNSINDWDGSKHIGIYAEASSGLDIYANEIVGFNVAIMANECDNLDILDNRILNSMSYGVFVQGEAEINESVKIGCNQIDMDFYTGDLLSVGIGFKYLSTNSSIYSNCILDCYVSMYGNSSSSTILDVPYIYNNFLYNYYAAGLYTLYYNSPGPSGISNIRSNTFFSNTYTGGPTGAWDVFALPTTVNFIMNMSFGAGIVSSSVVVTGSSISYSSASCGKQVYYQDGVSSSTPSLSIIDDPNLDCDGGIDNWFGTFWRSESGGIPFIFSPNFSGQSWNEPNSGEDDYVGTLKALAYTQNFNHMENLMAEVNSHTGLTAVEKAKVQYYYWLAKNEIEKATQVLENMQVVDDLDTDWKTLEEIRISLKMGRSHIKSLTEVQLSQLEAIIERNNQHSDEAASLYNRAKGGKEYSYISVGYPYVEESNSQNSIRVDQANLEVYPNPVSEELHVTYTGTVENPKLEVLNALGQLMEVVDIHFSAGSISLDVSTLENGVYMVHVSGDNTETMTSRFVKE